MDWICVYRAAGPTDASLLRDRLDRAGVPCRVRGDLFVLRGEIPLGDAAPTVWVRASDRERALAEVRAYEGPALVHPRWVCPGCGEENEAGFDWCWSCQTDRP